jgi:hypothetical protein
MTARSNSSPFFIVGSERSGTTLLMVMLGNHPRLAVPEVTWYYPRFRAYLHTYGDLTRPGNFRTLVSEMIFGLKTPLLGLCLNPATVVDELVAKTKAPTFAEAFRVILETYADAVHKPRWGEKTPHNLYYVREILQDFPGAKIINLVRDGRDVAVEQLRSAFGPRNVYAAAKIWKKVQQTADTVRHELPPSTWLDVRYEELVSNPVEVLTEVTAFLGESFDPATLEYHRDGIAKRRGQTRDHRPLGRPVTGEFIGIYRRYLSEFDQAVFAAVAGDELKRAGYAVEVPPAQFSATDEALWDEHDQRIRAATLDAPEGHVVYESYNDWLADQREERRRRGVWSAENEKPFDWEAQFISGQRAPLQWKQYFGIKRRYTAEGLVL